MLETRFLLTKEYDPNLMGHHATSLSVNDFVAWISKTTSSIQPAKLRTIFWNFDGMTLNTPVREMVMGMVAWQQDLS